METNIIPKCIDIEQKASDAYWLASTCIQLSEAIEADGPNPPTLAGSLRRTALQFVFDLLKDSYSKGTATRSDWIATVLTMHRCGCDVAGDIFQQAIDLVNGDVPANDGLELIRDALYRMPLEQRVALLKPSLKLAFGKTESTCNAYWHTVLFPRQQKEFARQQRLGADEIVLLRAKTSEASFKHIMDLIDHPERLEDAQAAFPRPFMHEYSPLIADCSHLPLLRAYIRHVTDTKDIPGLPTDTLLFSDGKRKISCGMLKAFFPGLACYASTMRVKQRSIPASYAAFEAMSNILLERDNPTVANLPDELLSSCTFLASTCSCRETQKAMDLRAAEYCRQHEHITPELIVTSFKQQGSGGAPLIFPKLNKAILEYLNSIEGIGARMDRNNLVLTLNRVPAEEHKEHLYGAISIAYQLDFPSCGLAMRRFLQSLRERFLNHQQRMFRMSLTLPAHEAMIRLNRLASSLHDKTTLPLNKQWVTKRMLNLTFENSQRGKLKTLESRTPLFIPQALTQLQADAVGPLTVLPGEELWDPNEEDLAQKYYNAIFVRALTYLNQSRAALAIGGDRRGPQSSHSIFYEVD